MCACELPRLAVLRQRGIRAAPLRTVEMGGKAELWDSSVTSSSLLFHFVLQCTSYSSAGFLLGGWGEFSEL